MADRSVRGARPDDAAAVAGAQAAAWRAAWSDALPGGAADLLDSDPAVDAWRSAITAAPTARHHVLVAEERNNVVGMAAFGPAEDDDLDANVDVEVVVLAVRPDHWRDGHGSRLLAAAVDLARADGFHHAYAWLPATDEAARAFLVGAGWGPDGVHRRLDPGSGEHPATQVRLCSDISDDG